MLYQIRVDHLVTVFAENLFSCSSVFADSDMFTDYADSGRSACGTDVGRGAKFCGNCGAQLKGK
jgi:hypothetical protein